MIFQFSVIVGIWIFLHAIWWWARPESGGGAAGKGNVDVVCVAVLFFVCGVDASPRV